MRAVCFSTHTRLPDGSYSREQTRLATLGWELSKRTVGRIGIRRRSAIRGFLEDVLDPRLENIREAIEAGAVEVGEATRDS